MLRTRHAQYDFWAINIWYISTYEQSVCHANTRTAHKFLKNFSNNTDVTQQKFISQLIIKDETRIHHFDSESEQQSMQRNERIGQIVISLHCVNPLFSTSNADNRRPLKCKKYM